MLSTSNFLFTDRMLRVLRIAEEEAYLTNSRIIMPEHLLLAFLQEKTGVLGEISLKCDVDISSIREKINTSNLTPMDSPHFKIPITEEIKNILEDAFTYMKKYNQIYVNEGHVLKALIISHSVDHLLTESNKNLLLTLGTTSRDMITHLEDYSFPDIDSSMIRKGKKEDCTRVLQFIEKHFSIEWAKTINNAFLVDEPPIYIAIGPEEEIIGFAAYDVYNYNKCYFGPMGVSLHSRVKGVGYALLHHCLRDMKEIGYAYAIIGGAGPIEFYEKACHAVVIPIEKGL